MVASFLLLLSSPSSDAVAAVADAADVDAPGSDIDALGRKVAARGADVYISWSSVRPSEMTGPVA